MAGTDYYDLDAILAEEELIPCVTQEEFSYLSHLDPDASAAETKRKHFLKKHTKLKLPVWAVESWAILGYCRCTLPRAYNSKSREQYLLSNANDAQLMALPRPDYFRTGKRIADMMQQTYLKQRSSPVSSPQMVQYRGNILAASRHLQHTLHVAFVGERFQQWLDWSWTSYGQDVSQFVSKLTQMEQSLFSTSAQAWSHHYQATSILNDNKRRQRPARYPQKRLRV